MSAATPWFAYPIRQPFKWTPQDTHAHSGMDIGDPQGTPITAPVSGRIISEGFEPWGGQVNELVQTPDGPIVLSFLHLSQLAPQGLGPVAAGARIGSSGTPPPAYGNGPHLHLEETHGSTPPYMGYNPWYPTSQSYPINPASLVSALNGGGTGGGNPISPACVSCAAQCNGDWGCLAKCSLPGGPCFNVGGGFTGATVGTVDVGSAIEQFQAGAADALKRTAVFGMAALLTVFGLYLMFKPQADAAIQDAVGGGVTAAKAALV